MSARKKSQTAVTKYGGSIYAPLFDSVNDTPALYDCCLIALDTGDKNLYVRGLFIVEPDLGSGNCRKMARCVILPDDSAEVLPVVVKEDSVILRLRPSERAIGALTETELVPIVWHVASLLHRVRLCAEIGTGLVSYAIKCAQQAAKEPSSRLPAFALSLAFLGGLDVSKIRPVT